MPRNSSLSEGQLTDSEYYILLTLLRSMHGYGIMQYIEKLTSGQFVIGPATLYTALKKMQNANFIMLNDEDNSRRKTYCLTYSGKNLILGEVKRRIKMAEHGIKAIKDSGEVLE